MARKKRNIHSVYKAGEIDYRMIGRAFAEYLEKKQRPEEKEREEKKQDGN